METLQILWGMFRKKVAEIRQDVQREKLNRACRRDQAALTEKQRELKREEQDRCALIGGHSFVLVHGSSQGDPTFSICQRCQKIADKFDTVGIQDWERQFYLAAPEAYPTANRPESELYEMPIEDLKALAEAAQ